jgi:hypothetical protein
MQRQLSVSGFIAFAYFSTYRYRVNPVYAIIEPGNAVEVIVVRRSGTSKSDNLVFQTIKTGNLKIGAKELFKNVPKQSNAMFVLPMMA